MAASRLLAALTARFDTEALRPPALPPEPDAAIARWLASPAWAQMLAFCAPQRTPRLSVATLAGEQAPHCAEAFACLLDGSARLAGLGRAAGLAWRLQVKLADALPWRGLRDGDPWDAGWARSAPGSLRHLRAGFLPRRATLVLADAAERTGLTLPLATLVQRADGFAHPVRWLWVDAGAEGPLRWLPA